MQWHDGRPRMLGEHEPACPWLAGTTRTRVRVVGELADGTPILRSAAEDDGEA